MQRLLCLFFIKMHETHSTLRCPSHVVEA